MKFSLDFEKNAAVIEKGIGYGESYDVGRRAVNVQGKRLYLYFLTGMVDSGQLIEIMEGILNLKDSSFTAVYGGIPHPNLSVLNDLDEAIVNIMNGMAVVLLEGAAQGIAIDVRNYPTRSVAEPEMEKVIRGAHDGFSENFHQNIQLLRRRIKDGRLRNKLFLIGEGSPAYVCLTYLEGVCDESLLRKVRKRLEEIETEHLIMTDKGLEELLIRKKKLNPYPLVRYTERADTVAIHLYQGMFALFVDTSPSVMLAPATVFDHMMHFEEYRQTPVAGTYLRWIRFLGIAVSLFLTPVWLILVRNDYLPGFLEILKPSEETKVGIYLQVLAAEVGVEFLRLASIHTPNSLATSMSLIAGFLLGDFAVNVGLFSIQTVLLVAISAIGTYLTPSYELGLANKISKLLFIAAILIADWYGFVFALLLWLIYLSRLRSFGKPYLYPLQPLDFKRLLKILVRFPAKNQNKRR
ncbi:MAG TPA: spore germination protein [Acholeplasmataceae bacterium]|nr:spore germination protein [Acholeplasmataceae bacterium]